jgi:hypothetical protein
MSTPDALVIPGAEPWTHANTRAFLTACPLPPDFLWRDRDGVERAPLPRNGSKGGYGKWLQETPYFPALFELCHEILRTAPEDTELTDAWLVAALDARRPAPRTPALSSSSL